MKILITAGPTSERIDAVRVITNRATGRLGSLIAESFFSGQGPYPDKIIYVCERTACTPGLEEADRLQIVHTSGTIDLAARLNDILVREKPDAVIHSMAVSDYRVESVRSATGEKLGNAGKISSDLDGLTVHLVPTPKIIGLVKKCHPHTVLVGFKLLDDASFDQLMYAAAGILKKNECDLVFANDARETDGDNHAGYIVYPDRSSRRIEGKKNIADAIVAEVRALVETRKETR